ncbi:hypothetical protein M885DRAFT_93970 [Pelagophyceae sp. CCMP2097]|nr:hypothetical protein M885DRAFT_93970 [Pelagophyceae sp. CCMP2097]
MCIMGWAPAGKRTLRLPPMHKPDMKVTLHFAKVDNAPLDEVLAIVDVELDHRRAAVRRVRVPRRHVRVLAAQRRRVVERELDPLVHAQFELEEQRAVVRAVDAHVLALVRVDVEALFVRAEEAADGLVRHEAVHSSARRRLLRDLVLRLVLGGDLRHDLSQQVRGHRGHGHEVEGRLDKGLELDQDVLVVDDERRQRVALVRASGVGREEAVVRAVVAVPPACSVGVEMVGVGCWDYKADPPADCARLVRVAKRRRREGGGGAALEVEVALAHVEVPLGDRADHDVDQARLPRDLDDLALRVRRAQLLVGRPAFEELVRPVAEKVYPGGSPRRGRAIPPPRRRVQGLPPPPPSARGGLAASACRSGSSKSRARAGFSTSTSPSGPSRSAAPTPPRAPRAPSRPRPTQPLRGAARATTRTCAAAPAVDQVERRLAAASSCGPWPTARRRRAPARRRRAPGHRRRAPACPPRAPARARSRTRR